MACRRMNGLCKSIVDYIAVEFSQSMFLGIETWIDLNAIADSNIIGQAGVQAARSRTV